jgi:phage recombination protein Bet
MNGVLTDYALMTEGEFTGYYGARIDDKPYVVLHHVDAFLLRLSKGERVEVTLNRDNRISKIMRAKLTSGTASKTKEQTDLEREEYNAKAAGTPTDKPGVTDIAGDAIEKAKAKLAVNGFGEPTPGPSPAAGGIDAIVAATKANAEHLEKEGKIQPCTSSAPRSEPSAAITVQQARPLTFNNDQVSLIKATVARGCTDTEFELLMYLAHQYQLDPIRRQIWAVKYGNAPASIFTGRDGFLEIAHRSGVFDGMESGVKKEGEDLIGWCKVYRKDMSHAFYVEVFEKEYSTGKSLWQSKPRIMIQKVAESSCLRRAFSVSGLYCPEEMPEQPAGA